MEDLFESPELIPADVQEVFDRFSEVGEFDYIELEAIKKEINQIGYDFDYDLDAVPYDLHKINNQL